MLISTFALLFPYWILYQWVKVFLISKNELMYRCSDAHFSVERLLKKPTTAL